MLDGNEAPRLAELIGALSLATDLAAGLALETAVRTCLVAVRLGARLGLRGAALSDVYYTGLLRFIGCTAFAHEEALIGGGDDQQFLRALTPVDTTSPGQLVRYAVRGLAKGKPLTTRARAIGRLLSDPKGPHKLARAHCDLAVQLAPRLGMRDEAVRALGQIYERFDGRGNPARLKGEAITLPARIMHVAFRVEAQRSLEGEAAALEAVRARAGKELDPRIAQAFLDDAAELLAEARAPSVWDAFLAAEPAPARRVPLAEVEKVARAFAHYVDLKSPFTLAHSTGVAALCDRAAERAGMAEADRARLRIAALLHDLGRVAVPNGIWDKPGPLNPVEHDRVREHAAQTARILQRTPLFAGVAALAGADHERADGSGYPRGLPGTALDRAARLLAAADAYHAMTEPRAFRAALAPEEAARRLAEDARAGRLDREAVEAVLAAAGHAAPRVRGEHPAQLSDREVEVLCLLARGLSNKQIASALDISPKTVQHHVAHVYKKTGIDSRAAAAVYAVQHDLIPR